MPALSCRLMLPEEAFFSTCKEKKYSAGSLGRFAEAISLAKESLKDKRRISGEPSFWHNLRVGRILAENRTVPEVVLAGLLHGLENKERIREQFGDGINSLVESVEEVQQIKSKNEKLEAEALRKIILTTLRDVKVILVKLANKLDNLETIGVLPKEEQKRIAGEVMEVYAPLASRLGVEKIKSRLEDLALKILNPRRYQEIADFLEETGEEREKNVAEAISLIRRKIGGQVPVIRIKGRPKHIYSIYRKITKRGVNLDQQYDLLGIRITVPEEKDCYTLLGLLHEHFTPMEGRLKDYIASPKPNLYRSIHTALRLPNGRMAEIQIRTPEMDELAEEGIAAHWRYKGLKSEAEFEKKMAWLRGLLELEKDVKSREFLETVKVDVFGDEIHCYTPKGDIRRLPAEATVLDFAYAIHEEVGNHTVGARVNGKFVPLREILSQGDVVEILTNKKQRPRRSWLKIVRSAKAKQKIGKSLREYEKLPAFHFRRLKPTVREDQGVLVESPAFPKALCILAKCCRPLPGEGIIGVVTKRRLISVHRDDCRFSAKNQREWVLVRWKDTFNQKIRFLVEADERSGLLADLLHTIVRVGFETKEAKAKLIDAEHAECSFLVIPRDLAHLQELVGRVKRVKGVKKVYFE